MSEYFDELCTAMKALAEHPKTIFIGQGVASAGTTMTDTLTDYVPRDKMIEFPVAEDMQMGFCIGLALEGWLPIAIYPRWNFLLLAANQLVNHLDALPAMGYRPKVIIRTAVPSTDPFYPGPQHDGNFTQAFKQMLRTVNVVELDSTDKIKPAYHQALVGGLATLLVEHTAMYGNVIPSAVPEK